MYYVKTYFNRYYIILDFYIDNPLKIAYIMTTITRSQQKIILSTWHTYLLSKHCEQRKYKTKTIENHNKAANNFRNDTMTEITTAISKPIIFEDDQPPEFT